MEGCCASPD